MLLDAHQHVNWHGYDIDAIVANMDEHHIDKTWLLTWDAKDSEVDDIYWRVVDPRRMSMPLEDVLEACRRYPDRFIPGYAPDPRDPRSMGMLESAVKMFSVKVYGEWKYRVLVDSPECINLFRLCGQLNLPAVIHLDVPYLPPNDLSKYFKYWYGGTIDNLARAVEACPDTIFLGHGPGFWRSLSGDADEREEIYPEGDLVPGGKIAPLMRQFPKLWCDLSAGSAHRALSRNREFTLAFIDEFQDRLLFARDQFDSIMYDLLKSLELDKTIEDKLFSGNALKLVPC
ncbi:amidohydrolase family protein [candidate division KSB1 bacterium]|nr:amidohydrolase family protein [candidate division KSB1 bacterium]